MAQLRMGGDARRGRRGVRGDRECGLDESPALGVKIGQREVPAQPGGELHGELGLAFVPRIRESLPEVVVLELEAAEAGEVLAFAQLARGGGRRRREELGMRRACGGQGAASAELCRRIRADGLEQVVARFAVGKRGAEDRLVDEPAQ
jgi:hypothetical protein